MARKNTPAPTPAKPTHYNVANQHAGPVMFPRRGAGNMNLPPLVLQPGTVTRLDAEEWEERKRNQVVQYYLDMGILAEVNRPEGSEVPVLGVTSTELTVPEHLSTEEEVSQTTVAKAGVRKDRTSVKQVVID